MKLLDFWRRYKRNKPAVIGLLIVLSFLSVAFFPSVFTLYDPMNIDVDQAFEGLSRDHPMGTDDLGRDMLSRIVFASRVSLLVGFLVAFASTLLGIAVGAISGFFGGLVDGVLMRITEFFYIVPRFFLALVIIAIVGPSMWNVIFILAVLSWPTTARIVRSQVLSLKEREFVEAARALGIGNRIIIFSEILPNALPPVIVNSSLEAASAILAEAGLSFMGLGDPNMFSWGYMLKDAQRFINLAWWMAAFPGLGIFLTVLGLNFVGDGINEALSPKLREI